MQAYSRVDRLPSTTVDPFGCLVSSLLLRGGCQPAAIILPRRGIKMKRKRAKPELKDIASEMLTAARVVGFISRSVDGVVLELTKAHGGLYLCIKNIEKKPLSREKVEEIERAFFKPHQIIGSVLSYRHAMIMVE